MLENLHPTVISVTTNIFETMFFLPLEFLEESKGEEIAPVESSSNFIRGEIGFRGKELGTLRLTLPLELAKTMASNFLGLEEGMAAESQIQDMVGELCNMICGNLLASLDKKAVWDLSVPSTQLASDTKLKGKGQGQGLIFNFDAEGYRVLLDICLGMN